MTSPRCATAIIAQLVAQGVREVALAPYQVAWFSN